MNKIKHLAFAVSGALLVTAGLISCDSDEVANEETTSTELKAKGGNLAYQDFVLTQPGDGYLKDVGDDKPCEEGDGTCIPEIVIDVDRKKENFLQMIAEPLNYRQIFIDNKDLLLEDFHPTLVNGVIDEFFKLETVSVSGTPIKKFRFKRVSDNVLVGTYQFVLD